ncbi:Fungal trans-domain-containing protein [Teratosphaeria destructans]|uniref:Fungal trans-domain-containing protein n=1 Tax=Teratosphaeria destructans TaxID=418781 RepID=A0A9W7STZ0_9PEZI|nr:Fungal trans-domain-containing protein [Teratosphaeria destructans]
METPASQGRRYKSRKERPCDACRRRKVCCIREPGDEACSLCRMQNGVCRYDQGPTPRRRRPATQQPLATPRETESVTTTLSRPTQAPPAKALASPSEPPSGEWISQYVGLSGDQDPFVLRHCHFNGSNYYRSGDWACLRVRGDGAVPSHFTLVPDDHLDARPGHYPSSGLLASAFPLHHDLLATYFDVIHPSYPLLDPTRFTKGNRIDTPLLATMYSLAKPFCPAARDLPWDMNAFVFQALPIEARSPRLDTIEAALLFLQRHTLIHRAPTTPGLYAEIGLLVGMCHDAGLNVDPSKWDLSGPDRSRRKRLWWALYIADKWSALGLGRPSYVHDEDCNVPLLTVDDIPQSTVAGDPLPSTSSRMFVAMAALTQILSLILSTFYTLKAVSDLAELTSDELVDLGNYFERTLFLAYYTAELALYKALLRCAPPPHTLCSRLRLRAKQTITAVSELLENLPITRLRAFWWSPLSRVNFAIAGGFMFSMLLSSIRDEDVDDWSAEIDRYRRLLEMQSRSFDATKLAAERMRVLATVRPGGRPATVDGQVDPKQAFCRDVGVELNTL